MKLSNFVLERTEGKNALDWKFFASVDVTTGRFFWKKTVRRNICREFASYYFFTDSGKYCPGYQAEALARAWTATTGEQA